MLHEIKTKNGVISADFSIMTVLKVCERYNIDITDIGKLIGGFERQVDHLRFAIELCDIAFNEGARRECGEAKYTQYDIADMLTEDMSLVERVISEFVSTIAGEEVFPTATAAKSPKKTKTKVGE